MAIRPPAEGERQALSGYVPQYKLFAAETLRALRRRNLVAISVADPAAGRLDDIQIETDRRVDAFQIKWTNTEDAITVGDFRVLLRDMVAGRAALERNREHMAVVAHTQTNRPLSTHTSNQIQELNGGSLAEFIETVWRPASRGAFESLANVPERWLPFLRLLATDVDLSADALLHAAPALRVELIAALPEDEVADDREGHLYLRDLRDLARALLDIVTDSDRTLVRIEGAELLRRVGGDWPERGRFRASGSFPLPTIYQEIASSAQELETALESQTTGYLFLFGSPGSGKSTLLSHLLRTDARLAASYYAYVPGDNTATRSEASTFLHDLVLTLERRGFAHGKSEPPIDDVDLLSERLRLQLHELAMDARRQSGVAIILIDGLDHVERAPTPRVSLLQYLPDPLEIPEGVLFVVGTRSPADLPQHLRPAARQTGRAVQIARLSRQAVLTVAERQGVSNVGELVWQGSSGHPLLMWTFVRLAESLPAEERDRRLSEIAAVDGDVSVLYEHLWQGIATDTGLVELLALVARIRIPFTLSWLEDTGSPPATVRKLETLRHLIDTDEFHRSIFFHDSFRVFVRDRTMERFGSPDPELDHARNLDLATRCASTRIDTPISWEEIHHRLAAADYEGALHRARPEFFRAQAIALRPLSEVEGGIREAAEALRHVNDANALTRLAMAASEVQSRSYNLPTGIEMLIILCELGRADVAIAQLGEIRDHVVGNDQRATAMEFATYLHETGQPRLAQRIFDDYEPLHLFGGPGADRHAVDGPWSALRAWARTAARIRGADYVIHAVTRLDLPADPFEQEPPAERLRDWRAHLLILAARAAADTSAEDAARYYDAAAMLVEVGSVLWVDLLLTELSNAPTSTRQREIQAELGRTSVGGLDTASALSVVETLLKVGASESAERTFREIAQPEAPEGSGMRDDVRAWDTLYRYVRLRGLFDGHNATFSIPDSNRAYGQGAVLMARHLTALALLEGSHAAGRHVPVYDLIRTTDRFFAFWLGNSHEMGMSLLRGTRQLFVEKSIVIATRLGQTALERLFASFEARWNASPHTLRSDGWKVLDLFDRAGIGEISISQRLNELETLELEVDEQLDVIRGWLQIGRSDRAETALQTMISRTFVVGYRKDYQLTEWIELLRPILLGSEGDACAAWIADKLVELDNELEGGATHDAGLRLSAIRGERSLGAAHSVASTLRRGHVIDLGDVIRSLLEISARDASPEWWILLRETLCPLGTEPPRTAALTTAAAVAASAGLDGELELRDTAMRVSVEGRPSLRREWREALITAATDIRIDPAALGISESDQKIGDETPRARRDSSGSDEEVESRSLDELIADFETGTGDYRGMRLLISAIHEAPDEALERILQAAPGREEETAIRAAVAERYFARGRRDAAWLEASAALRASNGRDWSRSWAGGPALAAIRVMRELDPVRGRSATFARFGELASEDRFLLSEVAREMPRFLETFAPLDESALAEDVSAFLEELIGAAPTDLVTTPDEDLTLRDFAHSLIIELLGLPYHLAWTIAQRSALEIHRRGGPASRILVDAFDTEGIPKGRPLALADAEVREGRLLEDAVIERIVRCAAGEALDVRLAAARLLSHLGIPPPDQRQSRLPGSLRIELPARLGDRGTAIDPKLHALEEIVEILDDSLQDIADTAAVDIDALRAYVIHRAQETPDASWIGRDKGNSIFGWTFIKPEARAVFRALAETAGVLVDAGRLEARTAVRLLDLTNVYDAYLLLNRPVRKPAELSPATPLDDRSYHVDDWLEGTESAQTRITKFVGDLAVIGETTLIRQLSRQGLEERRTQTLTLGASADIDHASPRVSAASLSALASVAPRASLTLRSTQFRLDTEHDWLSVHPGAAAAAGFAPSAVDPFAWSIGEQPAIRSVWWRSGFTGWEPYGEENEVGEGWLVLATAAAVERLREAFPEATVCWNVVRAWRPDGNETEERARSGERIPCG